MRTTISTRDLIEAGDHHHIHHTGAKQATTDLEGIYLETAGFDMLCDLIPPLNHSDHWTHDQSRFRESSCWPGGSVVILATAGLPNSHDFSGSRTVTSWNCQVSLHNCNSSFQLKVLQSDHKIKGGRAVVGTVDFTLEEMTCCILMHKVLHKAVWIEAVCLMQNIEVIANGYMIERMETFCN